MSKQDWYRNTTWNDAIAANFEAKLQRARLSSRAQYLRIQASTLAGTHPDTALQLLERYFVFKDDFAQAQGFVDRATAFLSLGRTQDAIDAYKAALAREARFPNCLTQAHLDLPCLIADRRIRAEYDFAVHLLKEHKGRLMFPVDYFRWHAALALIAAETRQPDLAKKEAANALSFAEAKHSGFAYHSTVGLVPPTHDLLQRLRAITG